MPPFKGNPVIRVWTKGPSAKGTLRHQVWSHLHTSVLFDTRISLYFMNGGMAGKRGGTNQFFWNRKSKLIYKVKHWFKWTVLDVDKTRIFSYFIEPSYVSVRTWLIDFSGCQAQCGLDFAHGDTLIRPDILRFEVRAARTQSRND